MLDKYSVSVRVEPSFSRWDMAAEFWLVPKCRAATASGLSKELERRGCGRSPRFFVERDVHLPRRAMGGPTAGALSPSIPPCSCGRSFRLLYALRTHEFLLLTKISTGVVPLSVRHPATKRSSLGHMCPSHPSPPRPWRHPEVPSCAGCTLNRSSMWIPSGAMGSPTPPPLLGIVPLRPFYPSTSPPQQP